MTIWKRIEERTGRPVKMPVFPDELSDVWDDYLAIKAGSDIVTWRDVAAYAEVMGRKIAPHHAAIIIRIDVERRATRE